MKTTQKITFLAVCIPFLLLSPGTHAQDRDKDEKAAEVAETEQTEDEKSKVRRAKETAEHAREAAEQRAKETAEHAREAAEQRAKEAAEIAETKEEGENGNAEHAKEAAQRGKEAAERAKQESVKKRPAAEPKSEDENAPASGEAPAATPQPPTEKPEPAESEVTEVTREVLRELDQRKTRIEGHEEAQALIDEILGAESRISRAEIAREERFRPRFERQRPGDERFIEVSPDQRREATTYYQERLRGREVDGPPPEFFRRSGHRGDRRDLRVGERVVERVEFVRPRYLNEGRRYVHFDSRAAIPAILMAAQAMNHVRFQPTREIAPIFYERQEVSAQHAMPLPPDNYRGENSWVVSYPVDENSMISSEDILFLQGSTQFADPYSYEIVGVLADAMKAMPEQERFVIEGHASAEGSYDSNMVLSQQRAEYIVRKIVRRGVSPYRLLPVGYGESEARHPADAAEPLRSQDRRVVVFRMKPEPIAAR